ncbi:GILT-like protein 1 [Amblyomma americanum]|uniref:Gamma-interferon inducible lysosomal thiol reductase n=1 Tax=Amblyomma americanum TaxID=6943 RepID=A0AAQ4D4E3_AMBAM
MGAGLLILSLGLLASGFAPCLTQTQPTQAAKPAAPAAPAVPAAPADQSTAMFFGGPQKVNVTVLYEPYCKDSVWFITKQLLPVYGQLRKRLIVEMVPFGRARMKVSQGADTTVAFACRHGQAECQASLIHACAINLYPDPDKHLPFIACTLKAWKPEKNVAKCCTANKMEAAKITGCASSQQGKILLRNMGLRTMSLKPPINYVPSVVIDGGFNKRYQKKLQKQFKDTVCKHFKPPVPEPCVVKKRRGWFRR